MAQIDVSGAYRLKNDLLRNLLHKGTPTGLKLWGPTSSDIGGHQEILTLTSGWNHKQEKNPQTGVIIEQVRINVTSVMTQEVLNKAEGFDILYADGTFDRYVFDAKAQPSPIGQEWRLTVTPSLGDKTALYVPPVP
jgi:hypothetical protein